MRLAGQRKGGFYPFAPAGVMQAAGLLSPVPEQFTLIDPCCGEGAALSTLAGFTLCKAQNVYGIELEDDRSGKAREALGPLANLLAPASFFDCRISNRAFGLAWVNPPFDDEMGGGQRVELSFLVRATELLAVGGVLMFVTPERNIGETWKSFEITSYLLERYDNLRIIIPRPEHRPYEEIIAIGVKRKQPIDLKKTGWINPVWTEIGDCNLRWEVPVTGAPRTWEKAGLTDAELCTALAASPLWWITDPPRPVPRAQPPLPLSRGHIALLLASGHLDGVVRPPGEQPHLVKGTALKVQQEPEVTTDVDDKGNVKTTTIIREEIKLVIRTVDGDGELKTFE